MAVLPLIFEATFDDAGAIAPFDSEVDTDSKGFVRHYSYLAKLPYPECVPYRGAYCYAINLAGGTNDCYLQELTSFDTAASGTIAFSMYFQAIGLTMATSDRFTIGTLQSGAGTDEATISVINNAGTIQLVAAETGATALGAATRGTDLIQNQWHCLELVGVIDSGGGNDGTLAFYVDGYQVGTTITGLDQAAITQARFGAIGIDAGTTAGLLLYDMIRTDTARVGQLAGRFDIVRIATASMHLALGPGSLIEADLQQSSAVDETMVLYDTDTGDTTDVSMRLPVFQAIRPVYFTKGVYCVLGGTNPIGSIKVYDVSDMDVGGLKHLGVARQGV